MNIKKVAVIGAGVMGASIAAHIANAGIPVYLLDIAPKDAKNRNIIAETAVKKLLKSRPPALMQPRNARLITVGNIEDDLYQLEEVDWVIEAIIENLAIKQNLYQKLQRHCTENTLISSNTSTLPLALLTKGLSVKFQQQFIISHFFNPPRYMRLLEIVASEQTRTDLVQAVTTFADHRLGKGCVSCKDTAGFMGNRIGIYWIQCGLLEAINLGLTIEEADAVLSIPFGIPKTGVFGLLDLVGLDLMPHVIKSMTTALPKQDAFLTLNSMPPLLEKMIAEGYTGRKGKGGFYRLNKVDGKRVKEGIDLTTGDYRLSEKPKLEIIKRLKKSGLPSLLTENDKYADYAWRVMSKTLLYAASLVPEISDDITSIDEAMRLGYNWEYGVFELIDQLGVAAFVEKLEADGCIIPPLLQTKDPFYKVSETELQYRCLQGYQTVKRAEGVLLLSDIKQGQQPVLSNHSASLWDIGDHVACLEFHSKMNTLDMDSMALIRDSIEKVKTDFSALIIHNEADNFSAGANLGLLLVALENNDFQAVTDLIHTGQQTYNALKYAPFPVVAAPSGLALGGGCEVLLHCDAIQAHAELYVGLVEVGVGLIPGWGGCKEYLRRQIQQPKRFGGSIPPTVAAFQTIGLAKVSTSAFDAKTLLFLSADDGISMNKARLLADAKAKALSLIKNYHPPEPCTYSLAGKSAQILLEMGTKAFQLMGKASAYDVKISAALGTILSGGDSDMTKPLTEADLLALELDAFLHLVKQPETVARLEHMLATGKPLRN
ncbi:MAG: 3-hydroxyacyl-CoA dehydrogenase/enoyl-CoA hydratase family protein [Methylococcales bacterium]|nr:3-hydroxyacyl-CoA dehydrogenase/enoyl-CoA hydratase family protein [Methylococcales bacterium]